ncbi:hypothetical protein [Hugenholtzia roseola]|uniref:hypothetical protein n=1 Tax=Hugenholtzia roseola TaxID=1002 RepID=UPI000402C748|nr:hypothetical protein [Hugenholtzia roseola]
MKRLSYADSVLFLEKIVAQDRNDLFWDKKKNILWGRQGEEKSFAFRFPLPFPAPLPEESLATYVERLPLLPLPYHLILVQAGYAALAYAEEGQILKHKAITAYMVRKKQGRAQLNYLKTKGKSRLGSRIRLQNTILFFENIHKKLKEWGKVQNSCRFIYSGTPTIWHLLYESKANQNFERKDSRFIKVPLSVRKPNFMEVRRINAHIKKGRLLLLNPNLSPALPDLEEIEW